MSIRVIISIIIYACICEFCYAQCDRNIEERFDCVPDLSKENNDSVKDICRQRQCCYSDVANKSIPACFYPPRYTNYVVIKEWVTEDSVKLLLLAKTALPIWPVDQRKTLVVNIDYINTHVVRVTIKKPNDLETYSGDEVLEADFQRSKISNKEYRVRVKKNPFSFEVIRLSTKATIFDTSVSDIIFGKRFKQITSKIGAKNSCIYGFAEHTTDLCIPTNERKHYTLFNRGEQPQERNDTRFNLYGFHPFYLALEEDGNAHGVYFHNTNAMDIVVQPGPTITYRTVGGHLDFFFVLGPTPDDVTSLYTSIVGRPILPPYWALGFHLCRYDYNSTEVTRKTWKRNVDAGIPIDVQWNDIDFMDNFKDFTYDPIKYKGLPDFITELHDANTKYIINISPGLSATEPNGTYKPYDEALEKALFVIDPKNNMPMIGKVWQNKTVWLDFTNFKTALFWGDQLEKFHEVIEFDGLWLDMNEPYNFRSLKDMNCDMSDPLMNIPYTPGYDPLSTSTICMYAKHKLGSHFDLHTLYSFYESKATVDALRVIHDEKRPFVLSRSTVTGQGRYTSHWNGDITSEWSSMRNTIANMLTFNIIGMPLIGADICGFTGNTTANLCLRWHQLGAFYSFSRNHNDFNTIEQDPVAMGPEVTAAAKKSLEYRYALLPYLYTLFYAAFLAGNTVVRPLFFEFVNDTKLHKMNEQFMWGSAVMFNPALYEGRDTVDTYFPKGQWFSNFNKEYIGPITVPIKTSIDAPNINFRAGYIVPMQAHAKNTFESRKNLFELLVYIDNKTKSAKGELYWDDGESERPLKYTKILFRALTTDHLHFELKTDAIKTDYKYEKMKLGLVTVLGVNKLPKSVECNSKKVEIMNNVKVNNNILYINLKHLSISLLNRNRILWRYK